MWWVFCNLLYEGLFYKIKQNLFIISYLQKWKKCKDSSSLLDVKNVILTVLLIPILSAADSFCRINYDHFQKINSTNLSDIEGVPIYVDDRLIAGTTE